MMTVGVMKGQVEDIKSDHYHPTIHKQISRIGVKSPSTTMVETTEQLHERYEPAPDSQKLTGDSDVPRNVSKDVDYEPHPERSISISSEHEQIIKHITNLYSGSASEADMQVYDEKAIYDDPLSYCDTRYKIAG